MKSNLFGRKTHSLPQLTRPAAEHESEQALFEWVLQNMEYIKQCLHLPIDLVIREFVIPNVQLKCGIVCIDGLFEKNIVNKHILEHIFSRFSNQTSVAENVKEQFLTYLENELLSVTSLEKVNDMNKVIDGILAGDSVIFVDGYMEALLIGSKGTASRAIEEPKTESLIRGPRDGLQKIFRRTWLKFAADYGIRTCGLKAFK